MLRIDEWTESKPRVRFQKNGYRFVVKADQVLVYERGDNHEYSLNASATEDRQAYDAKRYQIKKNQSTIDAIQTVLTA